MHTILVIGSGLLLLAIGVAVARVTGGAGAMRSAALVFLPLWLVGAGVNLYVGVTKAGYTVAEELPIFLLVFALPAIAALGIWWWLR